jgi:hypothetical protein
MEGVSTRVYKGIKGYWRRRGYSRLNGTVRRRQNRIELAAGSGSNSRKRFWKIRISPRLKMKMRFSPRKVFAGLRDAYMKMMMSIASSGVAISSGGGYGGNAIGGFGKRPMKEYDERMLIDVYKSIIMAQGQLVPRDACTDIICKR